jgi:hypothetical protein
MRNNFSVHVFNILLPEVSPFSYSILYRMLPNEHKKSIPKGKYLAALDSLNDIDMVLLESNVL